MKKIILSDKEIFYLSKLAQLKLNEDEVKRYKKQLEETLEYVNNLDELKTKELSLLYYFDYLKNVFFHDAKKNKRGLTKKQLTYNLKAKTNQYFVVKRIL